MRNAARSLAFAGLTVASSASLACSTCACGDYTITLMGAEKPYGGRLRAAVDFVARTEEKGTRGQLDRQEIHERRTSVGLSYSFGGGVTLGAQVPYVRKELRNGDLGKIETQGLGDADVILRWAAITDGRDTPRHLAGLRAGVRLPTSEEVKDGAGNPVDIDAQPDAGATAPSLGAWYGYYHYPVFVSVSGYHLFYEDGRQGFEPGDATLVSVSGQYMFTDSIALQLGLDARHTQVNRFSGTGDSNSGGTLAMGFAGGAVRFGPDFLVHAGMQAPVLDELDGVQEEKASFRMGAAYDF